MVRWARRALDALAPLGCLLAWAALAVQLAALRRHGPRRPALALIFALAGGALFAAGVLLARRGPRQAVLLAPCGGLPAGAEVWVSGGLVVLGEDAEAACPAPAVGLVDP